MRYHLVFRDGHYSPVQDGSHGFYEPLDPGTIDQTSLEDLKVPLQLKDYPYIEFPKTLKYYQNLKNKYKSITNTIKFLPCDTPVVNSTIDDVKINKFENLPTTFEGILRTEDARQKEKELAVKRIVDRLKFIQSLTKRSNNKYDDVQYIENIERKDIFKEESYKERKFKETKKDIRVEDSKNALQNIKLAAFNIVDENIKRAVTVAEEIKREIDVEITDRYKHKKTESERSQTNNQLKQQDVKNKTAGSFKSLTEQRAFSLGVKSIPYMKTYMRDNNFKTFTIKSIFLHLTKFLVSLSKHVLNKQLRGIDQYINYRNDNNFYNDQEFYEERILSGAEMSRKFGKTPLDFTERMDRVIFEIEAKSGIEHTTRSRSRSRSRLGENRTSDWEEEDEITNEMRKIGRYYRAFVTEEWSEYYDLGETIKTEQWESSMLKKDTIEKFVEEKIIQQDIPLTYIAIVEAHVYTNKDALIRDTLQRSEQLEKTALLINKVEQSAKITDVKHQIIEIKKEAPMDKIIVVETIEDITPVDEEKPFAFVEKCNMGVAVQNTTEASEPVIELPPEPTDLRKAQSSVEETNMYIANKESVTLQEEQGTFNLPDIKPRKSITLFEPPLKLLAKTSEVALTEPKLETFEISAAPVKTIIPAIETPIKSIAQTEEIKLSECQTELLEVKKSVEEKAKPSIEALVKQVAKVTETVVNPPKIEEIVVPPMTTEKPKVTFEELPKNIAESNVIKIHEPNITPFEKEQPKTKNVTSIIETPTKIVAEKLELFLNVDKTEILKSLKMNEEYPHTLVETPVQMVATTDMTSVGEVSVDLFTDKIPSDTTKATIETPTLVVAEKQAIDINEENVAMFSDIQLLSANVKPSIELSSQIVAQKNQTYINESTAAMFQSVLDVDESKNITESPNKLVAEKFEVYISDSEKPFDRFEVEQTKPKVLIESNYKSVTEIDEKVLSESSYAFESPIVTTDKTKVVVDTTFKPVAEQIELFIEKSDATDFALEKTTTENLQSVIQEPKKVLAETNVIIMNEPIPELLPVKESETKAPKILIDDSLRSLAESEIPTVEGPRSEPLEIPKITNVEAKPIIDKIAPTITTEVHTIPPHETFEVPEITQKKPVPVMEEVLLTVAESISTNTAEPKDEILQVSKTVEEHARINYKDNKAIIVKDISTLEPQCESLIVPEINMRQSRSLLEDVHLTAATLELNTNLGPKDEPLSIPSVIDQTAHVSVDELKSIETAIVTLEEGNQKTLEYIKPDERTSKVYVEDYAKTVAEKTLISVAESEKAFTEVGEALSQSAKLTVSSLAACDQITVTPIEEVKTGATAAELSSHTANVIVQQVRAADITHNVALSSTKEGNFEFSKSIKSAQTSVETSISATAKVQEIDVKESKCEITEVENDQETADISTEYTVELAKDETDIQKTKEAAAELKIIKKRVLDIKESEEVVSDVVLDINIQKDLEYMENGMTSIIESFDADIESSRRSVKAQRKAMGVKTEVKIIGHEDSKSPSPDTPVIDFYMYSVDTPREPRPRSYETESTELIYKTAQKREYTQDEFSVAQSIGIEYELSESGSDLSAEFIEVEYLDETEYLKRRASQTHLALHLEASEQHTEMNSEITTSENYKASQKKRKVKRSEAVAQALSQSSALQELSYKSSELSHVSQQNQIQQSQTSIQVSSNILQALESDTTSLQKDITVMEMDIESRHAKLSSVEATAKHSKTKVKSSKQKSISESSSAKSQDTKSLRQKISLKEAASSKHQEEKALSSSEISSDSSITKEPKSPSPPIQPPTPLTDEYMFRLVAPLPSREGTPVPRDCTDSSESEEEVIKKKLIPHMELTIEERKFDPPLPTPPTSPEKKAKPFYTKPGLRGGNDKLDITKEEILEIGRQSTLLATEISKTIKSIEEYKLEVGITEDMDYQYTSSEMKESSEFKEEELKELEQKEEFKREECKELRQDAENSKVNVLIDRMIETSRRFSGDDDTLNNCGSNIVSSVFKETQSTPDTDIIKGLQTSLLGERKLNMDQSKIGDQLLKSVHSMVDPNASLEERLKQVKTQMEELSRLPDVIQKTLQNVKLEFEQLNQQYEQKTVEIQMSQTVHAESHKQYQVSEQVFESRTGLEAPKPVFESVPVFKPEPVFGAPKPVPKPESESLPIFEPQPIFEAPKPVNESLPVFAPLPVFETQSYDAPQPVIEVTEDRENKMQFIEPKEIIHPVESVDTEIQNIIEKRRLEADSRTQDEIMKERLSQELLIVRERLSPRLGLEGRSTPTLGHQERFAQNLGLPERSSPSLGLPETSCQNLGLAGRSSPINVAGPAIVDPTKSMNPAKMWKKLDTYDDANLEQVLSETLAAQAEVIQGKAIGVNFKKYEKPPPPLDHLQNSEVYKAIHEMDQKPLKKVEMLKPAIAASDYVERLRSVSPSPAKTLMEDCDL